MVTRGTREQDVSGLLRRRARAEAKDDQDLVLARVEARMFKRAEPPRLSRYALGRRIGAGALGVVYEAADPDLQRCVAIKVLRRGAISASHVERLRREAAALARVNDPHVVVVYDIGSADAVFVVMERVTGQDLRHWLETPRDRVEILRVFCGAGRGLAAAHRVGVVHRDFKPANVLIANDGAVKVVDFGLARCHDLVESTPERTHADTETLARESATATGTVMGTPAYMAPEQHRDADVDARADQYAFCVSLFEALTGERPFHATTLRELATMKALGVLPASVRRLPRAVRRILARGMRLEPARRYASMEDLVRDLEAVVRPKGGALALAATAGFAAVLVLVATTGAEPITQPAIAEPSRRSVGGVPSDAASRLRTDAWQLDVVDDGPGVLALATAALEAAGPDDASLRAEATYWEGRAHEDRSRFDDARAAYERAFHLADAADVPSTAALAASGMVSCTYTKSEETMRTWTRHMWTQLERAPWDRAVGLRVASQAAGAAWRLEPEHIARIALDEATALAEDVSLDDDVAVADELMHLVSMWQRSGDLVRAAAVAERALQIVEASPRSDPQLRAIALSRVAYVWTRQGACDEALPLLDEAIATLQPATRGRADPDLAYVLTHLADCLVALHRPEAALEAHRESLWHWENATFRWANRVMHARIAIARLLAASGRTDEAKTEYARVIAEVDPEAPEPELRLAARQELARLEASATP